MKYKIILIFAVVFALTIPIICMAPNIFASTDKDEIKPLVLAFIPQENPEKLIGDISVITEYLQKEMGIPVKGYVTQDHAAAVEALRNAEADISFMGGLPYNENLTVF